MRGSRRVFAMVLGSIGAAAGSSALANDWSIRGFFSQRVGVDTNLTLEDNDSSELRGNAQTNLGATFELDRQTTTWRISPGISYNAATGRSNDINNFDSFNPRLNGSVSYRHPDFRANATFGVVPDLVSFTQLEDTGRTTSDAVQVTGFAAGTIERDVNALNSVSFSLNGRFRTFTENSDDLVDNFGIGSSLGWNHTLSPLTRLRLSASVQYFEADDSSNTRSLSYSLRSRISTELSEDVTLTASLGAALTEEWRDVDTPAGRVTQQNSGFRFGPVGDIGFDYDLTRDTRFSAGLSQSIDQNSDGIVVNRAQVRSSLRTQIDERNSVNFGFNFSFQNPIFSGDSDIDVESDRVFSFTPSYTYDIDRDWAIRVGYSLRAREDDGDVRISNGVFLTLSRNFSFLD